MIYKANAKLKENYKDLIQTFMSKNPKPTSKSIIELANTKVSENLEFILGILVVTVDDTPTPGTIIAFITNGDFTWDCRVINWDILPTYSINIDDNEYNINIQLPDGTPLENKIHIF